MRYNGLYTVTAKVSSLSTARGLIELGVADNKTIDILRCWVSPAIAAAPVDEIQEVVLYGDTAAGTGTAATEQEIQGGDDAGSGVTGLYDVTNAAYVETYYTDAYHLQNNWLYLPVPEERIRIVGADNFGIYFPAAQTAIVVSAGITWGELG